MICPQCHSVGRVHDVKTRTVSVLPYRQHKRMFVSCAATGEMGNTALMPASSLTTCHGPFGTTLCLRGDGEPACKPDSVRRFPGGRRPVAIHLCGLPGDMGRANRPLLGLAPSGGCQPPESPPTLVRSYRTLSPLPVRAAGDPAPHHRRSALCCPEPAGHPVLALASTLALWSPDFPRHLPAPRPPGRLTIAVQVIGRGLPPTQPVRLYTP
jgi:hypothetical protein